MTYVGEVSSYLQSVAPLELAESWDNVGLLVGRNNVPVRKIMTALTLVPENVAEAIRAVRPAAVDTASGVESAPGNKDQDKMNAFVQAAQSAFRSVEEGSSA